MKSKNTLQILFGFFLGTLLLGTSVGSAAYPSSSPFNLPEDSDEVKVLVRIYSSDPVLSVSFDTEVVSRNPGAWVDVILPQSQLNDLSATYNTFSVLIRDIDYYSHMRAGLYHSLAEMEQILQDLATQYPTITSLQGIGTTCEGRTIWCLEITDNPGIDEAEPGVFYMGVHHAREWPTLEVCLYIAQQLTTQYGIDPTITDLVNTRRIWITPCMNPDGYYYCHDQGHDWRKNRHFFPEFGTYGVDLNRNYAGSCDGNILGGWGFTGASHLPNNEVYCGPGPFSENETQAIQAMFLQHNICASITYHTYSEVVLWPWGYTMSAAPDGTYLSTVGHEIASRITKDSGTGTYGASQTGGITGDTTDWAYGYGHYVQGRPTFAFTIEVGSEFQPPEEELEQILLENYEGAFYLLQEAGNISQVSSRVLPPQLNEMTADPDGEYTVSWTPQNPDANPDMYQLDELTGFSLWTDDAETETSLWTFEGFALNTSQSHSELQAYQSRNKSNDASAMTTKFPVPVTEGMSLSFWCWYNIQYNRDYASVEVSRDGRSYELLDTFTGLSNGNWTKKTYSLDEYVGSSVFIRFRYTTDDRTTYQGFFVDDVEPVPWFSSVATLSDSITTQSFNISGKTPGSYYYRVKGHNTERGWSDFSTLQKIRVGNTSWTVSIESPQEHSVYIKNRRILPFFTTLVFGTINVKANVSDPAEITRVEFYLDDHLQATEQYLPYNWTWNKLSFFRHTIRIIAYDTIGNSATQERVVWKFF